MKGNVKGWGTVELTNVLDLKPGDIITYEKNETEEVRSVKEIQGGPLHGKVELLIWGWDRPTQQYTKGVRTPHKGTNYFIDGHKELQIGHPPVGPKREWKAERATEVAYEN